MNFKRVRLLCHDINWGFEWSPFSAFGCTRDLKDIAYLRADKEPQRVSLYCLRGIRGFKWFFFISFGRTRDLKLVFPFFHLFRFPFVGLLTITLFESIDALLLNIINKKSRLLWVYATSLFYWIWIVLKWYYLLSLILLLWVLFYYLNSFPEVMDRGLSTQLSHYYF